MPKRSVSLRQQDASERLTGMLMRFAASRLREEIPEAWQECNLEELPPPLELPSAEDEIFMLYFLFQWDPERPRSGKKARFGDGIVTQRYMLENAAEPSRSPRGRAETRPRRCALEC